MSPLYSTDPIAAVVFWTGFGVGALVEMITYFRLRITPDGRNRDQASRAVLVIGYWVAIFLGFLAAFVARSATIDWHRHLVFYFGVGLMLGGLLLRQYAIITLGGLHSLDVTTRAGQPVVEIGPYRWIRHPSYAGSMLTAAGILLCSTNWVSMACYLLVVVVYVYRIRVEERALAEDLGDAYGEYMRRTKRLIPFVI